MNVSEAISIRLKELLEERNRTVSKICKLNNIPSHSVYNICNGKSKSPNIKIIFNLCNALDITLFEFFDCDAFKDKNIKFE